MIEAISTLFSYNKIFDENNFLSKDFMEKSVKLLELDIKEYKELSKGKIVDYKEYKNLCEEYSFSDEYDDKDSNYIIIMYAPEYDGLKFNLILF